MRHVLKVETDLASFTPNTLIYSMVFILSLYTYSSVLYASPRQVVTYKDSGPLYVDVTTHLGDGRIFYENDSVSFFISSNKDVFLLLIYSDPDHHNFQIYPAAKDDNGVLLASAYRQIPGLAGAQGFRVSPPFGREKIWAFASNKRIPNLSEDAPLNGVTALGNNLEDIRNKFFRHCNQRHAQCIETNTTFFTASGR